MLVKLKRDWFDSRGVLHRANEGLAQVGEEEKLPRDAVVMSKTGSLPNTAVQPQPGFGAKPKHEQTLDLIPGAAPTHLRTAGGEMPVEGIHPTDEETDKEREAREKEAEKAEAEAEKARQEKLKEVQDETQEGLKAAKAKEDAEAKAAGDPTRKSQIKI